MGFGNAMQYARSQVRGTLDQLASRARLNRRLHLHTQGFILVRWHQFAELSHFRQALLSVSTRKPNAAA